MRCPRCGSVDGFLLSTYLSSTFPVEAEVRGDWTPLGPARTYADLLADGVSAPSRPRTMTLTCAECGESVELDTSSDLPPEWSDGSEPGDSWITERLADGVPDVGLLIR